jgi:ABC-2 type transport system permease protein
MNNAIFRFEIRSWLKSPVFHVLTAGFFLFSLATMLGTGGYFDEPSASTQNVKLLNTPYAISLNSFLLTKILLFLVAIFAGFPLYRDYKDDTHAILYSYPISKSYYLNGKLGAAVFTLLTVSFLTLSGLFLGEMLLGTENPKIGAHSPSAYIAAFGLYIAPSVIIIGIFVFVWVGISRNIFSGFVVVICFVLLQSILENILFDKKSLLALLDPFGQNAFQLITKDWNIEKQNSNTLPISHLIILNRLFWSLSAFLFYAIFARKFEFQYDAVWSFKSRSSTRITPEASSIGRTDMDTDIRYDFSPKAHIQALFYLMVYDFKRILTNRLFLLLSFFGILAVFFIQLRVSNTGDFNLHPFTRIFIGAPLLFYTLIVILSTFLFSGLLVHKARQHRMDLMLDAAPIKTWQLAVSKIGAVSLIHVVQLLLFLMVGLAIQITNGYYRFELDLYGFHLFILVFPVLLVWNITSHFIHSLVPNLFLGLFLLACIWLGAQSLEQIGIRTHLLKYNTLPALSYSDFDRYGYQLKSYGMLLSYWMTFGFLLLLGTILIWNRGSLRSFKERAARGRSRLNKLISFSILLLAIHFCRLAATIHRAESIDNDAFTSGSKMRSILEDYKKEWEGFSKIAQPNIMEIDLMLDLYPDQKSFRAKGTYQLVNQGHTAVDTIFIRSGFDEITEFNWDGKAQLLKEDAHLKSYLYKLDTALLPGDSLALAFTIENSPNTLFSRNSNVLSNGSYLKHDILPRLGYQFTEGELSLNDPLVNRRHYFHRDADYVKMTTRISTSDDQIAIAPGELISQKNDGERRFYTYITPEPVKINFSFHSADFEVLEEEYKDISLQLYHKKGHRHNIDLMMNGLKASIDFNTKWFGPYPYEVVRIIEFPHTEDSYSATLTANNIPASEILFNINSDAMGKKINLPFYVTAHELTHEWFGNQLMPADAQGAKMLTESMTEYITLCIYRDYLGEELANRFLEAQHKRYDRGKTREEDKEQPLYKVLSHQEYIAYGKGAIALNAMANSIGRDRLHSLLQHFLWKYKSQTDYYPTTADFLVLLKDNTTAEEFQVIESWLTETVEVK